MTASNWRRVFLPILFSVLLFVTACAPQPPSRFEQAQKESTQRGAQPAVAKDATQGSEFNKFFPKPEKGYERVFTQEKKGFAEAKLKKEGKEIAMLAISDVTGTPAGDKFKSATKTIAGYPAVTVGTTQTAILVNNRYQVKVLSRDLVNFKEAEREAWLKKFDLAGLAKLQAASDPKSAKPANAVSPFKLKPDTAVNQSAATNRSDTAPVKIDTAPETTQSPGAQASEILKAAKESAATGAATSTAQ
jgi:hypothetical protein